mmetsp:Transcript_3479/g.9921  ORF Transcript_3479/g.9921 Transcript_3479/m.9921 type:complete len:157 (-) Transcript_3479:219-689(-)|eukprot:CAMPEP_0179243796 /NCGR_PEP_ID=MMETSP0797-20121207/17729_1 /TAXON_ID=47934 /ORGANISM="Dinophysis acuminata, Strain DAEP01" /LENGTH=156 /DNA_ID=CAMNT_0020951297 /DNA_START=81 /DNA_END=551 /DNA_ORIENTATION=+
MAVPASVAFEGKEFPLWTEKQLESVSRGALKNRCLDLREQIGADRLPQMPRHPEGMVAWLLGVQGTLSAGGPGSRGGGAGAGSHAGPGAGADSGPPPHAPARGRGAEPPPHAQAGGRGAAAEDDNESHQAYRDAKGAANASRKRNQGSDMANIFGQ